MRKGKRTPFSHVFLWETFPASLQGFVLGSAVCRTDFHCSAGLPLGTFVQTDRYQGWSNSYYLDLLILGCYSWLHSSFIIMSLFILKDLIERALHWFQRSSFWSRLITLSTGKGADFFWKISLMLQHSGLEDVFDVGPFARSVLMGASRIWKLLLSPFLWHFKPPVGHVDMSPSWARRGESLLALVLGGGRMPDRGSGFGWCSRSKAWLRVGNGSLWQAYRAPAAFVGQQGTPCW